MPTTPSVPADKLALYQSLVAEFPDVVVKGATSAYTSLNGHMFSFLTKAGTLALRLPTNVRNEFIKKYNTQLCEQHGHVMKEYVDVPGSLFRKTSEIKKFFKISYDYIASLKPKLTTRKKASKKTARKTATKAALKKKK